MLMVDEGNSILRNLDDEINNDDMPSDQDEDAEDDPELLEEIEQNKINEIRINAKTFQRKYSNAKKYNN